MVHENGRQPRHGNDYNLSVIKFGIKFLQAWMGVHIPANLFYHPQTGTTIISIPAHKITPGGISISKDPDLNSQIELYFYHADSLDEKGFPALPNDFFGLIGSINSDSVESKMDFIIPKEVLDHALAQMELDKAKKKIIKKHGDLT